MSSHSTKPVTRTYSKCGDTKHRLSFNCPAKRYQHKDCKKYRPFTSKCFKLIAKKVQANPHLVSAQDIDHLQSFNQSVSPIQNLIAHCPSVSDTSDRYIDSNDSFFV